MIIFWLQSLTDYEVVNVPRPHRNSVEHIISSPSSPSKLFTPEVASLDHAKNHKISLLFKAIEQGDTPLVYKCLNVVVFFRFLNTPASLLHFQSPNSIGFYPLNKRDIFTGCYFHIVKISKWYFHSVKIISYCDITLCIARSI